MKVLTFFACVLGVAPNPHLRLSPPSSSYCMCGMTGSPLLHDSTMLHLKQPISKTLEWHHLLAPTFCADDRIYDPNATSQHQHKRTNLWVWWRIVFLRAEGKGSKSSPKKQSKILNTELSGQPPKNSGNQSKIHDK